LACVDHPHLAIQQNQGERHDFDHGRQGAFVVRLGVAGLHPDPFVGEKVRQVLESSGEAAIVGARLEAGDPQRAGCGAVLQANGRAGEEPDVRRPGHHGIVPETGIVPAVFDPDQLPHAHDMSDGHDLAAGPPHLPTAAPGAAFAQERDLRLDPAEEGARQTGRAVEYRAGWLQPRRHRLAW
jgi:hypothetical protein